MKIEFIYTYAHKQQDIVSYPFVMPILQDKETLLEFALSALYQEERAQLVKISTCIYLNGKKGVDFPEWYENCNGKFYFGDGE